MNTITFQDFEKVEIRAGTIIEVTDNIKAKKPAYVLRVDFGGELGIKTSSAQLVDLYQKHEMLNKKVLAVTNFAPKNIAGVISEVLVLGVPNATGQTVLIRPDKDAPNGARLY